MASVFWDAHEIIFIDNLEKGRTVSGAYYAILLDRLVDEIRKKRPHLKKKKINRVLRCQLLEIGVDELLKEN